MAFLFDPQTCQLPPKGDLPLQPGPTPDETPLAQRIGCFFLPPDRRPLISLMCFCRFFSLLVFPPWSGDSAPMLQRFANSN